MRKRSLQVLAAAVALALAGLFAAAVTDERGLAFTLGVRPTQIATVLAAGDRVCQRPIDVPSDAAQVEMQVGTFGRSGPELEVSARSGGRLLGSGRLPAGYPDNSLGRVKVGGIREGKRIAVCVANAGPRRMALYGGPAHAARTSALFRGRVQEPADLTLVFQRSEPRSMLSLLPTTFERAALFHPSWVEGWLMWVMAALVAIVVPLILAAALAGARD